MLYIYENVKMLFTLLEGSLLEYEIFNFQSLH